MRGAFGASAWTESFYKSTLTLTAPGAEAEEAPQFDVASIAGGSAKDADAALDAVSASLKASAPRRGAAPAAPPTADTPLEGSYGKRGVAGKMRGVASRDGVLRGTWQESGARGAMRLELSADGLSFSGLAKASSGESYEWTGNRLADPSVAAGGSARARWEARTLALRSRAHLKLGKLDDAAEGAAEACRRCPTLPCAWEAVAEAALQASDAAALRIGLKELLYLQPETAPALPIRVSNARRTQRLVLEQLERGELTLGPSKLKERAFAGDPVAAELDAIFAERASCRRHGKRGRRSHARRTTSAVNRWDVDPGGARVRRRRGTRSSASAAVESRPRPTTGMAAVPPAAAGGNVAVAARFVDDEAIVHVVGDETRRLRNSPRRPHRRGPARAARR